MITINVDVIIKIAAVLTALGVIGNLAWKIFERYHKIKSYDSKIAAVESKIAELQADTQTKMQQIQAEQCMQTYVLQAVLEGLHQQGCNGPVSEAREKLSKYINKQAHRVGD